MSQQTETIKNHTKRGPAIERAIPASFVLGAQCTESGVS